MIFVCQLNPSNEDKALYITFSRFGTVMYAKIIRDHKNENIHVRTRSPVGKYILRWIILKLMIKGYELISVKV